MAATELDSLVGQRRDADRTLFTTVSVVAILVVIAGFARTYYAKAAFGTPQLSAMQHLHGLVMSAWFVIFAVQVRLVATRRVALHRKLGVYGAIIAALVLVVGSTAGIMAAAEGRSPPGAPPPLVFLAVPLGDMVLFAILAGWALLWRRRTDWHQRLMTAATIGILTAPIARIPIEALQRGGLPMFFAMTDLILIAFIAWDTWRHRRLHPAFAWGLAVVVLSEIGRFAIAGTPQWLGFARWLTT